jgi:antirestriction protein ArdC
MKQDVYERITAKIVTSLEQGVRPWLKPWNAEAMAGRITRPSRSNGVPYRGINIVMLWMEALEKGYSAQIEQIDGLPPQYHATAETPNLDSLQRIERAESFLAATGAQITHGGTQACYVARQRSHQNAGAADFPRRRKLLCHARV